MYSKITQHCIEWIREFFRDAGRKTAVVGISGGKDSAVCAKLCVEALGQVNVIGVLMPNGVQPDIDDSRAVISQTGIRSVEINIIDAYQSITYQLNKCIGLETSAQAAINLAPRLRMATLYAVAQSADKALVCNCTNYSEAMMGYGTLYGDIAGDFSPLGRLTVSQVMDMGEELGLSRDIARKPPADGLTGKTDEDNLGFTYDDVEKVLAGVPMLNVRPAIEARIKASRFKRNMIRIPVFEPEKII